MPIPTTRNEGCTKLKFRLRKKRGNTVSFAVSSTSGDANPTSLKTARLMAEMIKLGEQMRRISYEDEERMERMRKEIEESLGRIHRSSEALSVRIENIK